MKQSSGFSKREPPTLVVGSSQVYKNDYEIYCANGCMSDFYIINTENLKVCKRRKPRKYTVLYYVPINCWQDELYILQTDNLDTVIDYAMRYGLEEDDINLLKC